MLVRICPAIIGVSALIGAASACAMSVPEHPRSVCRVVDGGKLPAETGGSTALCDAIERAAAHHAPGIKFSAEIQVISPSRLSASLVANGRRLPDQKFAISDRNLGAGSIERFAEAIGIALAAAANN